MKREYRDFMQSEEWKKIRDKIIGIRGRFCEKCDANCKNKPIHLHHKDYDFEFGCERDEDLMLLCQDCHNLMHQDVEFFDNVEMVGICPQCRKPMFHMKNKFKCLKCGIEIEPKIK